MATRLSSRPRQQSSHERRLRARASRGHGPPSSMRFVELQKQRQFGASTAGPVQVFDRSPVCTHALATYLGRSASRALMAEIRRTTVEEIYESQVLFVRNLGFCEPTSARRISFQESLVFETFQEQSYRAFGFELIDFPPAPWPTVSLLSARSSRGPTRNHAGRHLFIGGAWGPGCICRCGWEPAGARGAGSCWSVSKSDARCRVCRRPAVVSACWQDPLHDTVASHRHRTSRSQ